MKIKEFQKILRQKKIDAAVFLNREQKQDPALQYFSQTQVDHGILVVPSKKPAFLVIPGFDYGRIKKISPIKVVGVDKSMHETLKQKIGRVKRIGINEHIMSISEAKRIRKAIKAKLVPVSDIVSGLRLEKTKKEIALLEKSCQIACKIMNECISKLAKFKTEQEAAAFLQKKAIDNGCELAFNPIVASTANAAFPHHTPAGKLKKGFVIIDFGVKHKGYCSDITRTVYLGKPSEKEREVYEMVLKAQEWAVINTKQGRSIEVLEHKVTKKLGKYGKNFIHRLGHSVGVQVHDAEQSKKRKKHVLKQGMCWTIEPGIYVSGSFGIRIEDTIIVEKTGCRVLTAKTNKAFKAIRT